MAVMKQKINQPFEMAMVVHTFNLSSQKAEIGGSL